jgi:hypothetical protein
MPRAKRPLAEVDGNAINVPPSTKRKSTGQELFSEQYWSMNKARLQATLRDRDLPVSGNKDELISRLTAHDGETTGSKKQPKTASKAASKVRDTNQYGGSSLTVIGNCQCAAYNRSHLRVRNYLPTT